MCCYFPFERNGYTKRPKKEEEKVQQFLNKFNWDCWERRHMKKRRVKYLKKTRERRWIETKEEEKEKSVDIFRICLVFVFVCHQCLLDTK